MMPKVVVFMSVYNGQKYLKQQIESILQQQGVNVSLWVRDDGSCDGTPTILATFKEIHVTSGPNVGLTRSFLHLLHTCSEEADYYAFADADDVWLLDKLREAISLIAETEHPTLYASRLRFVDADLRDICMGPLPRRPLSFRNALVESRIPGATSVLNRGAFSLLRRYDSSGAAMHDAWAYLVISAFGSVIYDPRSFILYRQHGSNALGGQFSIRKRWKMRVAKLRLDPFFDQAVWFYHEARNDLPPGPRRILETHVAHGTSFRSRLRYALRPSAVFQRKLSDYYFRARVLFGVVKSHLQRP